MEQHIQSSTPRRVPAHGSQRMRQVRITFEVGEDYAPAFRSAVLDFSNYVGEQMESRGQFEQADALVRAAIGLGKLRAATCAAIAKGDKTYIGRRA